MISAYFLLAPTKVKVKQWHSFVHIIKIDDLQMAMIDMKKVVDLLVTIRHEKAIFKNNIDLNFSSPSVDLGDFVIVSCAIDRVHKLLLKWFWPCSITAVYGSLVFGVTTLIADMSKRIYCPCLLKYEDSLKGSIIPQDMTDLP